MASNMFEDLVPPGGGQAAPPPTNMFEDLVPQKAEAKQPEQPLGSLRDRALQSLPPDLREYARKALSPADFGWQHTNSSYSPYKPAEPGNMPNDAINPVGTDAQMAAATALAGGASAIAGGASRAAALRPPPLPGQPPVNFAQMPTQQSFGAQMARNTGGEPMPTTPPPLPAQAAGQAAQSALLQQTPSQAGLLGKVAAAAGGGVAHTAAEHLPFPFNTAAHIGLKMMNF